MQRLEKFLIDNKIKYEIGIKNNSVVYITIFSFIYDDFIRIYKEENNNNSDFCYFVYYDSCIHYYAYSYLVNFFIPHFVFGGFL